MEIKEYVPLAPYTKFHLGGDARYFISAKTETEILHAVEFAKEKSLSVFVLGGGSNILISDSGFAGLTISVDTKEMQWSDENSFVIADAGVSWDHLVGASVLHDQYGLEALSGIPGKIGGAAIGNIGAYGTEVKDTVAWVEALDMRDMQVHRFTHSDCNFSYRHSFFKTDEGKNFIILRTAFQLNKNRTLTKAYKDIAEYEKQHGTIETLTALRAAILQIRGNKFPSDNIIGTAGSFFKNPLVDKITGDIFREKYPETPVYPGEGDRVKISAAWIIDKLLHMKGVRQGNVGAWETQALVLVNYGDSRTRDVVLFAKKIIDACKIETGITLEPEVVFVGEFEEKMFSR